MKKYITAGLLVAAVVALGFALFNLFAGSADAGNAQPPLAGSDWQLESIDGQPLAPGSSIDASFTEDQVAGSAGCNRYFGGYVITGGNIEFGAIGSTRMLCGDEAVNQQEMAFLQALSEAERYKVSGDRLEISYADGKTLIFTAQ
jgi:heat shock protein HslJ